MNIRVFIDGQEVDASKGEVKVIVEGLGVNLDRQLHVSFGDDGPVFDVVEYDGQVSGTYGITYDEWADRLCPEEIS